MRFFLRHRWDIPPGRARLLQEKLSRRIVLKNRFRKIRLLAGADIALRGNDHAIAGVIVYAFPSLTEVERVWTEGPLRYPYVPGLLSFREGPLLLEAFKKLKSEPDLLLFDGQGIAHPRFFGIASHIGLILNKPSIGCAKSRLFGDYRMPPREAGSFTFLRHGARRIGAVVRSRTGVKPIFVSPGTGIDIRTAVKTVLACCDGLRIPKPTREADHLVARVKRWELKLI